MSRFRHLETTTAKETRCGGCGAAIITALDEGQPARVDATPLRNRQAEIAALIDGKRTYTKTPAEQLWYRDETQLRKPPDDSLRIHAEHKCSKNQQLRLDLGA